MAMLFEGALLAITLLLAVLAAIPPRIVIPDFTDREFLRWRWENYNGL